MVAEGDLGTDITRRFTADINQPLAKLGHGAALRLNVMAHESNVAERDVTENSALAWRLRICAGTGNTESAPREILPFHRERYS